MQNKSTLLQHEHYTLEELANIWPLTIDEISKYACERKIKLGVIPDGWAVRLASRDFAMFDYISPSYSVEDLGDEFLKVAENIMTFNKPSPIIQEPVALMVENLMSLRNNGCVTISFVTSFDLDKYFLLERRNSFDTRYRGEESDERLWLTSSDIKTLITTRAEKERFENTYLKNLISNPLNEKLFQEPNAQKHDAPKLHAMQYWLGLLLKTFSAKLGHAYLYRGKPKQKEIFDTMMSHYKQFGSQLSNTGLNIKTVSERFRKSVEAYEQLKNNVPKEFLINGNKKSTDHNISLAEQNYFSTIALACRAFAVEAKLGDWDTPNLEKIADEMLATHLTNNNLPTSLDNTSKSALLAAVISVLKDSNQILIQNT